MPCDGAASGSASAEIQAFAAALPERLVGYLLAHYLERRHPVVAGVGELLGLLERNAAAATAAAPAYVERKLRLDLLGDLLDDPLAAIAEDYSWGADLQWEELLDRLARFANSVAKVAFVQPGPGGGPPVLRIFMVDLGLTDDPPPAVPGIRASTRVDLAKKLDVQIPLRPGLALDVGLAGDLNAGTAIDLMPPGQLRVDPPATTVEVSGRARIGVAVTGVGGEPVTLLGIAGGSGLQAEKVRASVGSDLRWDVGDGKATGDVLIEVAVEDGAVVIDLSGADGFLSAILPDGGLRVPFDLLAGWSSTRGLYFEGGAGLAIDIPIDVELGPIKLQLLHLGFTISPDGLELEASGAVGAKLGPFALAVERMGTTAALTFPATGGNLGPADLDFAFKPPSGIGLALDAGVVKGGGYLFLDPDKGEYAGILELSFGPVSIKAIGILTTKLPGGEDGWALLLLVFGEFTAVQLGFGFTLNGVGGIIGLQHGVSIEALQSGLRTGVLDSVLFPRDPVANAPTLIGQLRVVFPIVPRALTVGPGAQARLEHARPGHAQPRHHPAVRRRPRQRTGVAVLHARGAARPAQGAGPAGRRAGHRRPGPDPPPGRHPRRVRRAGAGALGRRRAPRLPRRAAPDHRLAGGARTVRRRPDVHPRRRRLPPPVHRPAARHPAAGPGRHPAGLRDRHRPHRRLRRHHLQQLPDRCRGQPGRRRRWLPGGGLPRVRRAVHLRADVPLRDRLPGRRQRSATRASASPRSRCAAPSPAPAAGRSRGTPRSRCSSSTSTSTSRSAGARPRRPRCRGSRSSRRSSRRCPPRSPGTPSCPAPTRW